MSDRTALAQWATRRPPEPAVTPGRTRWLEPDGLAVEFHRYGTRWCCTVSRPGRSGDAAAVRDTREEAVAAVAECLASVREGEARRVAGSGR